MPSSRQSSQPDFVELTEDVSSSPLWNRGPRAHLAGEPHVVHVSHRRAVDRHERGDHHLHARLGTHAARHDVVAGPRHHPPRQRHRPDSDDPQRPRRHEVRRVVSGVVPCRLRRQRRQRAGDPARDSGLRLVRHPNLDRRARLAGAAGGRVGRLGECPRRHLDFVRDFLAGAGRDHHSRPRRHQDARELVGAAAARRRRGSPDLGDQQRRRAWPHSLRGAKAAAGQHTLLDAVSGGVDRQRRLLGNAEPQHSRLHPIREVAALTSPRPGPGIARDDDGVRVSRGRGDERDDRDLRRSHLGSSGADRAHRQPDGRDLRCARDPRRADHHEHGRERGLAGE